MDQNILIIFLSIFGFIVLVFLIVFFIWMPQIISAFTITKIREKDVENKKGEVYEMKIIGNYHLDKLLKKGVKSDEELSIFIAKELTKNLMKVNLTPPEVSCSAFTAINKENGHRFFGRNYDLEETSSMLISVKKSKHRHASISSVDLKFIGLKDGNIKGIFKKCLSFASIFVPLDGVNDAGVSCGIFMSYQGSDEKIVPTNQNEKGKLNLTSTIMLRTILDKASSTLEAIKIIENSNLHDSGNTSFHYMIADKNGNNAIVEYVNETFGKDLDGTKRKLRIYTNINKGELGELENNNDFMVISNFILTKDYYFKEEDKKGLDRYKFMYEFINKDGRNKEGFLSKNDAIDLLKILDRRDWNKKHNQSIYRITPWSALYDLTDSNVIRIPNEEFDDPSKFVYKSLKRR